MSVEVPEGFVLGALDPGDVVASRRVLCGTCRAPASVWYSPASGWWVSCAVAGCSNRECPSLPAFVAPGAFR